MEERLATDSALGWSLTWVTRRALAGVLAILGLAAPAAAQGRLEGVTDFFLLEQAGHAGLEFVFTSAETGPNGQPRVSAGADVASTDGALHGSQLDFDRIEHSGGFVLNTPAGSISMIDFALVRISSDYDFQMVDSKGSVWLDVHSPHYQRPSGGLLITDATLAIGGELAAQLGNPALAGFMLGELTIDLEDPNPPLTSSSTAALQGATGGDIPPFGCGASYGPPVDVALSSLSNLGQRARLGGRVALAPVARLLNVGPNVVDWGRSMPGGPGADESVSRGLPGWIGPHPNLVIHLYRQQGSVIEQIGLSDVKHAFLSINTNCDSATCQGGQLLGLGCGDVYGPGNNSNPLYFGPREEVSAFTVAWNSTGSHFDVDSDNFYSHPTIANPEIDSFEHRLVVNEGDLQTANSRYYAEGWYLVAGDTNIFNSMAHLEVTPSLVGAAWMFTATGSPDSTQGSVLDEIVDPTAVQANQSNRLFDTGAGQVQVTGIATDNGNGTFTYDYALMNFDYDAQVQSFSVPLAAGAVATNAIFRGNGETPGPAWTPTITANAVTWQAPMGDGLDWGRLVSFSVVVDRSPVPSVATLSALETSDDHILGVVGTAALAQNDDPAMAVAAPSGSTFGTLAGADAEGTGVSSVADGQADVWYSYTSPSTGTLRVHTCGSFATSGVDTGLSLHSAIPGTTGNELAANDNFSGGAPDLPGSCASGDSLIDLAVVQGQSLFVRVAAAGGPAASFQLTLVAPVATNDAAAMAEVISGPGTIMATLEGATPDGSSTSSGGTPDLWYRVTAASTGTLVFDTCGSFALSGSDTFLSVHSGTPGTAANELGENDDSPYSDASFPFDPEITSPTAANCNPNGDDNLDAAVAVNVVQGQTVFVRVTHFGSGAGAAFTLNVAGPGSPAVSLIARNPFDVAPRIDSVFNNYFAEGDFVDLLWGSTGDTCDALGSWTGARSTGPGGADFFAVFNDGPYTLQCTGAGGTSSDSVTLRVDPEAANNLCGNSPLVALPAAEFAADFFADVQGDELIPSCAPPDGASVWYEIVPNASGTLAVSTIGSNYDTVLSILDGGLPNRCQPAAFELACNDDAVGLQSRVVLAVTAGQSLMVRVAAFGEFDPEDPTILFQNPDQLSLSAGFITPLVNDACADATAVAVPLEGAADTLLFATTSDATVESNEPTSTCGFEEATVWYRVTASANQRVSISTAGSGYDTVLAVYDGSEMCGSIQTELGCNDDAGGLLSSEVVLSATAGQVFLVRVSAFPGTFPTELILSIPEPTGALQGVLAVGLLAGLQVRARRARQRP